MPVAKKAVAKKATPTKKASNVRSATAPNPGSSRNRSDNRTANPVVGRVGNLGSAPELFYTDNGTAYARVSLAYTPYDYETREQGETDWYRLVGFNQMAEQMAALLETGMRVCVVGRGQTREWTDENNETHTQKEILVDGIGPDIRFVDSVKVTRLSRNGPRNSDNSSDEEPF